MTGGEIDRCNYLFFDLGTQIQAAAQVSFFPTPGMTG
jgi:hypothetical protein